MIYFDSAATSFQKPASVAAAMWESLSSMSSPGRGGYPAAARAADTAFQCRSELAEMFDPPVTKSCLNHRLRKLMELAERL